MIPSKFSFCHKAGVSDYPDKYLSEFSLRTLVNGIKEECFKEEFKNLRELYKERNSFNQLESEEVNPIHAHIDHDIFKAHGYLDSAIKRYLKGKK